MAHFGIDLEEQVVYTLSLGWNFTHTWNIYLIAQHVAVYCSALCFTSQ